MRVMILKKDGKHRVGPRFVVDLSVFLGVATPAEPRGEK